ncbi:MAG: inositol monophosphatase [Pirellulaceae bacterium]|nr:inositol monophosphatase [Pirellulaceae bacterium]
MQDPLAAACDAARGAGRILLEHLGKVSVREKAQADLVTDADVASQQVIMRLLAGRFPQYAFLGEESSAEEQQAALDSNKPVWVVDPLDGTVNFVHQLAGFSVSIALVVAGQVRLGVVYDPLSNSLYTATHDGPAMRDGKPIRASACLDLSSALVCCSFPPAVRRDDPTVEQFLRVLERCQSLRRLGSAALNLCYLAEGSLDAYWASSVKCWDVAAGYLIAQRAGVIFSHLRGDAFDLWNPLLVAAASPTLHGQMLECMAG